MGLTYLSLRYQQRNTVVTAWTETHWRTYARRSCWLDVVLRLSSMAGVHDSIRQAAYWCIRPPRCPARFLGRQHWRPRSHAVDHSIDDSLFERILRNPKHVLHPLPTDHNTTVYCLRQRRHDRILPSKTESSQNNHVSCIKTTCINTHQTSDF